MFKHHFNSTPDKGERNTQPSKTIPDQTMTIRQIMDRFARGLPVGGARVPMYEAHHDDDTDSYTPDPRTLDLVDIQEMQAHNRAKIEELRMALSGATASPQGDTSAVATEGAKQGGKAPAVASPPPGDKPGDSTNNP